MRDVSEWEWAVTTSLYEHAPSDAFCASSPADAIHGSLLSGAAGDKGGHRICRRCTEQGHALPRSCYAFHRLGVGGSANASCFPRLQLAGWQSEQAVVRRGTYRRRLGMMSNQRDSQIVRCIIVHCLFVVHGTRQLVQAESHSM